MLDVIGLDKDFATSGQGARQPGKWVRAKATMLHVVFHPLMMTRQAHSAIRVAIASEMR